MIDSEPHSDMELNELYSYLHYVQDWRDYEEKELGLIDKKSMHFTKAQEHIFVSVVLQQESFWSSLRSKKGSPLWILVLSLVNKQWREFIPKMMSARILTQGVWNSDGSLSVRFGISVGQIKALPKALIKYPNEMHSGHDQFSVFQYVMEKKGRIEYSKISEKRKSWRKKYFSGVRKELEQISESRKVRDMLRFQYRQRITLTMENEGMTDKMGMHGIHVINSIISLDPSPMKNIRFFYYIGVFERKNIEKLKRQFHKEHGHCRGAAQYAVDCMRTKLAAVDFDKPFNEIVLN